jgi:hypothetical protein
MFFARRRRRPLAGWLILLLLFMQAATAVYACPQLEVVRAGHAEMAGCDQPGGAFEMDAEHPLLCIADCVQEASAPSASSVSDVPASAILLYVAALTVQGASGASPLHPPTDSAARGDPPPGWPPPYLLHRVLRN